jgi:hypothetical protein
MAINAAVEDAATLTIVLPKSIIMSNSLEFLRSLIILFELLFLLFSNFFIWIFDNEKKAVSDPEKKAERIRNPKIDINKKFKFTG